MKKAYRKDIIRTIYRTKKRFFSIAIITALGVTVLTGIYATCQNLYHSSDAFYDSQNLFDIRVVSTTGLSDMAIDALQQIDRVEKVVGGYSEVANTEVETGTKKVAMTMLPKEAMNTPHILEGRLPSKSGEIAVAQAYLDDTDKHIGETVTIDEIPKLPMSQDGTQYFEYSVAPVESALLLPVFPVTEYTITGVVLDPMNISNQAASFRSNTATDYTFFIEEEDIQYQRYSVIYLTIAGLQEENCYSTSYQNTVDEVMQEIEQYKDTNIEESETWYIQDRMTIDSYTSLQSDMSSIESVGKAFPIVFLVVAVLISLTTMTRMIEEERGLLGTYTALGFSNTSIYMKYTIYALFACVLGGIIGDILGFIALPLFLNTVLQQLYILPEITLGFDLVYGIGGVLLFVISIVVSTLLTSFKELRNMPAVLMRPKAPRAGARILLERIPFLWKHLRFLNKVTARNLFRFKKRLFMTIIGIMGCTALVLIGFAIRDSVQDLMPKQYEQTYKYDLLAVGNPLQMSEMMADIEEEDMVTNYTQIHVNNYKLLGDEGDSENVQLMVFPTDADVKEYIGLRNTDGQGIKLTKDSVFVTQNAAEMLSIDTGDTVLLQDQEWNQETITITDIVQNYLGNTIYMSQEAYESLYGEFYSNALLANLTGNDTKQIAYANDLVEQDSVLSAVSTSALKTDFEKNFTLINSVVYVLILLAAALAFVVLFTLSNTNIMERNRELATIKVLGFFDGEVHAYVNKETLLLTSMGILIGLPVGQYLSGLLTSVLKMPSLYFAVHIEPISYLIAALLSFVFAIIVTVVTNRSLDTIDMVEALKSVE